MDADEFSFSPGQLVQLRDPSLIKNGYPSARTVCVVMGPPYNEGKSNEMAVTYMYRGHTHTITVLKSDFRVYVPDLDKLTYGSNIQ